MQSSNSLRTRLRSVPGYMLARLMPRTVVDAFHVKLYRNPVIHTKRTFLGTPVNQIGGDLWTYQEIVYEERPAWILQTGVAQGGSVLWFAHLLDLIGAPPDAVVIGIDIDLMDIARTHTHPRLRILEGSSTDPEIVRQVEGLIPTPHGLVVLDSDHSEAHVRDELEIYHRFCEPGRHLVVEDTNVNGRPVFPSHGPGPHEAVDKFLAAHPDFRQDESVWEHNLLSFHQHGWLVRDDG